MKGRVVILVRDTSSRPVLHFYQIPSKQTKGYLIYRVNTKSISKTKQREITPKVTKDRVVIIVHNTSAGPIPLRKHTYSNILKILPPKNENFQIKISDIFHISAQNIDCEYSLEPPWQGSCNEYPQSMFLSRIRKNNEYPFKPQFYYTKVGFKGVKII